MNPIKLGATAFIAIALFTFSLGTFYVIDPGERGIVVTMGKVPSAFSGEGLGFKFPIISDVTRVSIRQHTQGMTAETFSSDLQQVKVSLKIFYRVPESAVVTMYQQYSGNPFDSLIAPRVQEALKEVTALESAQDIVKKRENVKTKALDVARAKIGNLIVLEDLVIENIDLSTELETAIEQKMVQEQEAAKAKFTQQKAEIDAKTAIIRAEGEAKAIKVRGDAIRANPGVVDLAIAEKWNGVAPLVVGGGKGASILLPMKNNQ